MPKKILKHSVKKSEKVKLKSAVKSSLKPAKESLMRTTHKAASKGTAKASHKKIKPKKAPVSPGSDSKNKKSNLSAKAKVKPQVAAKASQTKAQAPVKAQARTQVAKQEAKNEAKATPKKTEKTESDAVKAKASAAKPAAEKVSKKNLKVKKVEEDNLVDDFIPDDDVVGDEIGEYEEELKAVETLDIEAEEELEWISDTKSGTDEDIYLTDADGNRYCRAKDCDQISAVDGYCRFHYLLFWKRIQVRKKILSNGKFDRYIEELMGRYPDKFLEMARRDLRTQKDFQAAIQELEIDESERQADTEDETQSYIDEVRGIGEATSGMEEEEF